MEQWKSDIHWVQLSSNRALQYPVHHQEGKATVLSKDPGISVRDVYAGTETCG